MKTLRRWSLRHAGALMSIYRRACALAPTMAPLAQGIGPQRLEKVLLPLERAVKSAFFDCRQCGQCELSATGLACPMSCGKHMRNGPCGGVRADGSCEVHPQQRCMWLDAAEGKANMAPDLQPDSRRPLAPLDHRRQGRSTWMQLITAKASLHADEVNGGSFTEGAATTAHTASLEKACSDGRFVVTVEIAPPDSADPAVLLARARRFEGLVDAINITDGAGANCHMSSVAAAAVLSTAGFTPVCQVGCRDRNRIALQGDVLGAAALGVRNVLCLTGDDVSQGDHPQAKPVFDLDSVNLLRVLHGMSVHGEYASGRRLDTPPRLFLGATANPFVPPFSDRVDNLERKIDAGARFIQTQFCFDIALLERFMERVCTRGLHTRAAILVGVGTLASARALRWMGANVPGVHVPEAVVARVAAATDQRLEGMRVCMEIIAALRCMEGVAGVHLMGHRNEATLAQIITEAGLRRPAVPQEETT